MKEASINIYAHSICNKSKHDWQLLEDHLNKVATLASEFAKPFCSEDWAWNAGWLHDLGKATQAFQQYLNKSNGFEDSEYDADGSTSNHASAGAAFAIEKLGSCIGKILAYLSAGHHAGLPDWYTSNTGNAALIKRLEEGCNNLKFIKEFSDKVYLQLHTVTRPPNYIKKEGDYHHWIRMLFSCLVDADFLDTESFMDSGKASQRGQFESLDMLSKKFISHIADLEKKACPSDVNKIRLEIKQTCELAAAKPKGLFTLTVPTGGGKTLSAMAFALKHALKNGQNRIIYVIPYTSIIEQTAETLALVFGKENIVEHHSNLDPEKETQTTRLASENWDAPIIITTNVQFFESLYAAKSSRCRKLHNIVNSVVILDEAQLLPEKWLAPCVDVMGQLAEKYGVSLVLSTATQPALFSLPKPYPRLENATEIIPEGMKLYERLRRVNYSFPSMNVQSSWDEIAAQLQKSSQVLCVVNSRRDCYDLFKLMPKGTFHLSASMCGAHRSKVIHTIKEQLKSGETCHVISTQLVEAGVDIDFPVVFRALAGMSSIAQSAGRCNREGRLNQEDKLGQVIVFVPPKSPHSGLLLKGEQTTRELYVWPDFDPHSPKTYTKYFELLYSAVNDVGLNWLEDRLVKNANPDLHFDFRVAGQEFRLIDDYYKPVFVKYGDSEKWIDEIRKIGPTRENLRRLQRYIVNLSGWNFKKAQVDGLLDEIYEGYFCWAPKYDEQVGVDIFGQGWSPDDLVI